MSAETPSAPHSPPPPSRRAAIGIEIPAQSTPTPKAPPPSNKKRSAEFPPQSHSLPHYHRAKSHAESATSSTPSPQSPTPPAAHDPRPDQSAHTPHAAP